MWIVAEEGRHRTAGIALGRFDFHDVGAEVGEEFRAHGAGKALAQIENLKVVKRNREHHLSGVACFGMRSVRTVQRTVCRALQNVPKIAQLRTKRLTVSRVRAAIDEHLLALTSVTSYASSPLNP